MDGPAGYVRWNGYIRIGFGGKYYFAHSLVFLMHYGYFPEHQIDHLDQDKSNNRIDNLREASRQCNMRNCGTRKDNTSGIKGVCYVKARRKWRAHIGVDNKLINIGDFDNFTDAVRARYNKEKELNWSRCDLNSPAYQYLQCHEDKTKDK